MKTKTLNLLGIVLLGMISFTSCGDNKTKKGEAESSIHENTTSIHKEGEKHWSYEGETSPEHWAELEVNDCDGIYQSPINIITEDITKDATQLLSLEDFHYSPSTHIRTVKNNGHSIVYNFNEGDYLNHNNKKYKLVQFHFHSPSEHLINGVRYPLEVHMVHIADDKEMLVLSFMAEEGKQSEAFTELERFLPLDEGQEKEVHFSYDFSEHITKDFKYYHYKGSLTTPPCTEGVSWFIAQHPIILSEKQVELLHQSMPNNNYRPVQKLNGRMVSGN